MSTLALVGNILAVLGSLVFATAALGLVRFPDTYTRLSAVGTAGGLGIILIITGVVLYDPSPTGFILLLLIIGLQLSTSSIGSIAIGRSAYLTGSPLVRPHFNELDQEPSEASPNTESENG
ncbi:monovalent cation/H(+) antiporter subunit G [Flaviflexus salsibiostraticola]|uniref:Monovalent cation/H(+) antiporter subunit G n=1 Tax=Flaviflexus salsibiostraticola TaxID=1282737 RepID=A0A3S8Z8Z2_9ACTO|nr:monovalent cation/H(+) antiporter subunit G [Flaviflexus salsibiostraticola]AZN29796.1 monovalent cation/H(+) antiporter subunit G [Flaviflexus salsibiostraticola]